MTNPLKEKPFYEHNVRKLIVQWNQAEISFSRMVEMLNEVAFEYTNKLLLEQKDKISAAAFKEIQRQDKEIEDLKNKTNEFRRAHRRYN